MFTNRKVLKNWGYCTRFPCRSPSTQGSCALADARNALRIGLSVVAMGRIEAIVEVGRYDFYPYVRFHTTLYVYPANHAALELNEHIYLRRGRLYARSGNGTGS